MTDEIRNGGRKEKEGGRTMGEGTAKSADEKVNVAECNSITCDELERCKHIVASVEHEFFDATDKGVPFVEYAKECTAAGRRFSIHAQGSYFSEYDVSDRRGESIRLNHNDAPILARLVVERVPQCLPFVELRRSKWDEVFAERPAYAKAQEAAS